MLPEQHNGKAGTDKRDDIQGDMLFRPEERDGINLGSVNAILQRCIAPADKRLCPNHKGPLIAKGKRGSMTINDLRGKDDPAGSLNPVLKLGNL